MEKEWSVGAIVFYRVVKIYKLFVLVYLINDYFDNCICFLVLKKGCIEMENLVFKLIINIRDKLENLVFIFLGFIVFVNEFGVLVKLL